MSTVQSGAGQLSETGLLATILRDSTGPFESRLRLHYLLTGQNSLPALFFIRRQIAQSLATSAAVVFANPYMARVDVFRRMIATKMSEGASTGSIPARLRVQTFDQAKDLMRNYERSRMPLAAVTDVNLEFKAEASALVADHAAEVESATQYIINGQELAPNVTPQRDGKYWPKAAEFMLHRLARHLPQAIRLITGQASSPCDFVLTRHLSELRSGTVILGILENCIWARLKVLESALGKDAVPRFAPWSEGFEEYGIVAAAALARANKDQAAQNITPPFQGPEFEFGDCVSTDANQRRFSPEVFVARGLMQALLEGEVSSPARPDFPEAARPYPRSVGIFWGWGAEACRPNQPTPPNLISAVLRPECALAGENGAVLGAIDVLTEFKLATQLLDSRSPLLAAVTSKTPGGLGTELRKQLAS
jgi:hypothetical protein